MWSLVVENAPDGRALIQAILTMEAYFKPRSDTDFSHGIFPGRLDKHFPVWVCRAIRSLSLGRRC
jgi:hypothetical protein